MTYREDYAIRLYIKDELCTLELESLFVNGSMTSAESLTIVEEANAALVGHWNASTATEFNTDNEGSREVSVDFIWISPKTAALSAMPVRKSRAT